MNSARLSLPAPHLSLHLLARVAALATLTTGFSACTSASSSGPDGAGGNAATGGASGTGGHPVAVTGGASGGGTGGSAGGGASGQGGAPAGTGGSGGASVVGACPADATFCSGFETPGMPTGSTYKANAAPGDWTRDFALDTTMHNSGSASLRVKSSDEAGTSGAYKMLAVPAPSSGKFWVRFYIRSELDIGGVDHNAFVEAAGSDDPNEAVVLELAEDVGLAFNSHDDDRWPTGFGRLTGGGTMPFTLPLGTWHCVELSFDSTAREQLLFAKGTQQIDATNYPVAAQVTKPFTTFRFGFNQLHGPARVVWYDDVTVGPTRSPCP